MQYAVTLFGAQWDIIYLYFKFHKHILSALKKERYHIFLLKKYYKLILLNILSETNNEQIRDKENLQS